jgi:hypothetical protein
MRRLVWLTVLAIALAVPAVGFALSGDNDGTLSVKAGIGRAYLNFNGSAVGRVARGWIQVTDANPTDGIGFDFSNCDVERDKTDTTTICRGTGIRFRAISGKYQIVMRGSGIYLSAVGQGYAVLNGAGDLPGIDVDGTYSLNDGPYKSLPDLGGTVTLAAPSGGG